LGVNPALPVVVLVVGVVAVVPGARLPPPEGVEVAVVEVEVLVVGDVGVVVEVVVGAWVVVGTLAVLVVVGV
jgi:hypothetical protein